MRTGRRIPRRARGIASLAPRTGRRMSRTGHRTWPRTGRRVFRAQARVVD